MKSKPSKKPATTRQQIIQTFYVFLEWNKVNGGGVESGEGSLSELPLQIREAASSPELDVASLGSRLTSQRGK
jgi:hypothetical protein